MTATGAPRRLTSLLRVEERLLEAEHFVKRMARERGAELGYDLNGFLAAARSVTFLLQKEFSKIEGFSEWWMRDRVALADDPAARFFLELRNFSQKEGRISLVGVALKSRGRRSRWSYRFAGGALPVPSVLLNRDVVDCCREHLSKLARMVLRFSEHFPFNSCPRRAMTPEGVRTLRIDLDEVDRALGYPAGWTRIATRDETDERIRCLARCVDAVDFGAIRRISRIMRRFGVTSADAFGERLATSMVIQLERQRHTPESANPLRDFMTDEILGRRPKDNP